MLEKLTPSRLLTVLSIGFVFLPSSAAAQAVGYGHVLNDNFRTLELLTSSPAFPSHQLFDTGVSGVEALALAPGGLLYAVVHDEDGPETLWTLDPVAFEALLIGDLGIPSVDRADLASDSGGGLWLVTGGVLYSVDTGTGQTLPVSGAVTELATIAFLDDTLFGVEGNPVDGWTLVEVDTATAVLTPLVAIPGIEEVIVFLVGLDELSAMDFDDDGGLWISAVYVGGVNIGVYRSELYYLGDPFSGEVTSHAAIDGEDRIWPALAVTGSPSVVVEIPALDSSGLLIFALALAASMVALSRSKARAERFCSIIRR